MVDGVQALTHTRRDTFDALVVDVMMPGIDGLGVCRVLRAEGDRTPMLMLTARVETPDRVAGLDAGADDYLPKPFVMEELMLRINAVLPSTIDTEANRKAMPDADHARWVTTDSLGDVIQFLLSERARDISGAAVPVYGRANV